MELGLAVSVTCSSIPAGGLASMPLASEADRVGEGTASKPQGAVPGVHVAFSRGPGWLVSTLLEPFSVSLPNSTIPTIDAPIYEGNWWRISLSFGKGGAVPGFESRSLFLTSFIFLLPSISLPCILNAFKLSPQVL